MFLTQTVSDTTLRVNPHYKSQTTTTLLAAVGSVRSTVVGTSNTQQATDRSPEHRQTTEVAGRGVSTKGFETWSCILSLCPRAVGHPQSSPGKWQHRRSTTAMQEGLFVHISTGLCATSLPQDPDIQ